MAKSGTEKLARPVLDGIGNSSKKRSFTNWCNIYNELERQTNERYGHMTCKVGLEEDNKPKNRWGNVIPNDEHRVRLTSKGANDYINASKIESYNYIVTQGPLEETTEQFWTMVLEKKVPIIVMLCKNFENGIEKCYNYWPCSTDTPLRFETFSVHLSGEKQSSDCCYHVRSFKLETTEGKKCFFEVEQFHYHGWPDFGVPENPGKFVDFVFEVRKMRLGKAKILNDNESLGPDVIHCSAGLGRSGAFCLIDACCNLIEDDQKIGWEKIVEILLKMRRYRSGLVQTWQQLRFAALAVLDIQKCKITNPNSSASSPSITNVITSPGAASGIIGEVKVGDKMSVNMKKRGRESEEMVANENDPEKRQDKKPREST